MATSIIKRAAKHYAVQLQLTLPSSVTISSGGTANLLNNTDITALAKSADLYKGTIPTNGVLVGAVYLWSSGSSAIMFDLLVYAGNKVSLRVWNYTGNSITVSAVRLLTFWEA